MTRRALLTGDPLGRSHPQVRGAAGFWLPLPGLQGSRLFDLAGGYHGTLTNGPTWATGPNGFGALAVGSSDGQYADCGTTGPWMSSQSQLTVEAVCIPDATGVTDSAAFNGFRYLVSGENTNTGVMQFTLRALTGGGWSFITYDGTYYTATATLSRVAGRVYHLVGTYRAGVGTFVYVRDSSGNYATGSTGGPAAAASASPVSLKIGGSGEQTNRQWSGTVPFARYDVGYCTEAQAAARWEQFARGFPDLLRRTTRRAWAFSGGGGVTAGTPAFACGGDTGGFAGVTGSSPAWACCG